jgi:hypothetical protein
MSEKKRVSCPIKHINFYIVKHKDGSHTVKCINSKVCGDSCPYLKNPDYKSEFKRAPAYKAK